MGIKFTGFTGATGKGCGCCGAPVYSCGTCAMPARNLTLTFNAANHPCGLIYTVPLVYQGGSTGVWLGACLDTTACFLNGHVIFRMSCQPFVPFLQASQYTAAGCTGSPNLVEATSGVTTANTLSTVNLTCGSAFSWTLRNTSGGGSWYNNTNAIVITL
ncbi:unnamed protein product [uncultured bacterium]|nr:unnamed protein product [uncultured bacterium]